MSVLQAFYQRNAVRELAGRATLVTGAASGIGRATALAAAQAGARLVLTDISADALTGVTDEIRDAGGTVLLAEAGDVADHAWVTAFGEQVAAEIGVLDVVMNVAGIATWGTVENLSHEQWRRIVEVNLMGPIHIIETFVPPMVRRSIAEKAAGRTVTGGHLVNVSSAAGLLGLPWHAAYSATKFGLRGVSEVLRFDLRRHRIGVSLVCPGGVATPLVGTLEIAGVDRGDPVLEKQIASFHRIAVSPEKAAEAILRGVTRGRYLVYTSPDVRFGYFWARTFPYPYLVAMRLANDRFDALARRSRRG